MSGRIFAVSLLFTATAGCGVSAHRLHAAEPATAPPPAVAPAGIERTVGNSPEGIVYDAVTNSVVVALRNPDRLAILDPTTLEVRRLVSLPGSVRHLQLAVLGGSVLVPVESSNSLLQVSLPAGSVTVTPVGKQPHDATALLDGRIVVGNEFGRSLSVVRFGSVVKTLSGVRQPGGVIGFGSRVAVVDVGDFTVDTFDVDTGTRIARVSAGRGPTHEARLAGNRLLVIDTRGEAARIFDIDPLRLVSTYPLAGTPYGVALDDTSQTAWITLTARNEVVGLDVSSNEPRLIARYPTVRQPNTVAVSPGGRSVWVTGTSDGMLQLIVR